MGLVEILCWVGEGEERGEKWWIMRRTLSSGLQWAAPDPLRRTATCLPEALGAGGGGGRWYWSLWLAPHLLLHAAGPHHSPLLSLCLFQSKFCKEPSRHHHHNLNNRKLSTFCTQYKVFMRYFQVVQEYERAVIFRLGRLLSGGSKGPGNMFVSHLGNIFIVMKKP